jgi:hypothetical protein
MRQHLLLWPISQPSLFAIAGCSEEGGEGDIGKILSLIRQSRMPDRNAETKEQITHESRVLCLIKNNNTDTSL